MLRAVMSKKVTPKGKPIWFVGVAGEGYNTYYDMNEAKRMYDRLRKDIKEKGTFDLDIKGR